MENLELGVRGLEEVSSNTKVRDLPLTGLLAERPKSDTSYVVLLSKRRVCDIISQNMSPQLCIFVGIQYRTPAGSPFNIHRILLLTGLANHAEKGQVLTELISIFTRYIAINKRFFLTVSQQDVKLPFRLHLLPGWAFREPNRRHFPPFSLHVLPQGMDSIGDFLCNWSHGAVWRIYCAKWRLITYLGKVVGWKLQ